MTAKVVLTERSKWSLFGWLVYKVTGSNFTHAFILVDNVSLVEAWIPWVRRYPIAKRLKQLRKGNRSYIVMEIPDLPWSKRSEISREAEKYVGRRYAMWSVIRYLFTRRFSRSKYYPFCSRLISAAYYNSGYYIFDERRLKLHELPEFRIKDILDGYPTPVELLKSELKIVGGSWSEYLENNLFGFER